MISLAQCVLSEIKLHIFLYAMIIRQGTIGGENEGKKTIMNRYYLIGNVNIKVYMVTGKFERFILQKT